MISICIPAYNQPELLRRCLLSITRQTRKDLDVIVCDDSTSNASKIVIESLEGILPIHYYHHSPALGSPGNWNSALAKACGDFVMLLHQDDWLHDPEALDKLAKPMESDSSIGFTFCRNHAVDENGNIELFQKQDDILRHLAQHPEGLILSDEIGPPSNVMLRNNCMLSYNEQYIWLVDVEFYIRLLRKGMKYQFIPEHLVSIGIHSGQLTNFCRSNPDILIRENVELYKMQPAKIASNIRYYDFYWRLLRNSGVKTEEQLRKWTKSEVPGLFTKMISFQSRIPASLLSFGPASKTFMLISYLFNQHK